jgi:hypothetical protein
MAAQVARVLGHLTIVGLGGGALPRDLRQAHRPGLQQPRERRSSSQ